MSQFVSDTTPYPWPYDGDLSGPATTLLVVVPADGGLREPVDGRVRALADAVRAAGGPVLVVRTCAPPPSSDSPTSSDSPQEGGDVGAAAARATARLPDDIADAVLESGGIDGFYASDLDLLLRTRGTRRLLLAGAGLETCVHSTMRDANDRGYECLLVVDACEPVDPGLVGAAISTVEMSGGIFGAVGRTPAVAAALAAVNPVPSVPTSGALP